MDSKIESLKLKQELNKQELQPQSKQCLLAPPTPKADDLSAASSQEQSNVSLALSGYATGGYTNSINQPLSGLSNTMPLSSNKQPQGRTLRFKESRNDWTTEGLWITPTRINATRSIRYVKNHSNHIHYLELYQKDKGVFGFELAVGEFIPARKNRLFNQESIHPKRDLTHNVALMEVLESYHFNQNSPYVLNYPSNALKDYLFQYEAPLENIVAVLPRLFNCIENLEGLNSTVSIKDEIMKTLIETRPNNFHIIFN
jgi:hypothetical protein